MTTQEWLSAAASDAYELKDLLRHYHPASPLTADRLQMRITARGAEDACIVVRNDIRQNFEGDPVAQFDEALAEKNVGKINTLLNDAWFGVPESTECWTVTGFAEAVALIEDLPEDEE